MERGSKRFGRLLCVVLLAGCATTRPAPSPGGGEERARVEKACERAEVVPPDVTGRRWRTTVTLEDGTQVEIRAEEKISVGAVVQYQDEKTYRTVYSYRDSLRVEEVRVSREDGILFVKVTGPVLGRGLETWIYRFDLVRREKLPPVRLAVEHVVGQDLLP